MNREGGRFSDGLILGILIGGAIVFLLGTEKGKKVLKLLTDEGSSALEGILKELDDPQPHKELPPKHKKIEPEMVPAEELSFSEHIEHSEHNGRPHEVKKEKATSHRFFKRSKPL